MDIPSLIAVFQQCAPEFASSYCIVNGAIMKLNEIQAMGYDEFARRSKTNMPLRLYRYYPNIESNDKTTGKPLNYSLQALENNTVFLQTPTEFDDVYDSDIHIDYSEFEHLRLIEYCHRCGFNIDTNQSTQYIGNVLVKVLYEHYNVNKNLKSVFTKIPDSEIEKLSNEWFTLKVVNELNTTHDFGKAISSTLQAEYRDYISKLQKTFRTTCFTTTPYSQLMWGGSYANFHKGFCIEYTVLPYDQDYKNIFYNLFPMIYCKIRPDMASRLVAAKDKELTKDILWDIYLNGALRKSIDWAFQNEWRLLLPFGSTNISDYNIKFFPITKVYLGNRIQPENRKKIIKICNQKNIPYIGVKRSPNLFEMKDCETKCENCPHYQNA